MLSKNVVAILELNSVAVSLRKNKTSFYHGITACRICLVDIVVSCDFLCCCAAKYFFSQRSLYMSSRVRLSVVCLSVTFVRHTQAIEIFGNVSTPFGTLTIHWLPAKILRSSQWNPSVGEWGGRVNARGIAKYSDFGPIEGYISEMVQDRR